MNLTPQERRDILRSVSVGGRTLDDIVAEYTARWDAICTHTAEVRSMDRDCVRNLCAKINGKTTEMFAIRGPMRPPLVLFFPSPVGCLGVGCAVSGDTPERRAWWREHCPPESVVACQRALDTLARAVGLAGYRDDEEFLALAGYLFYTIEHGDPSLWYMLNSSKVLCTEYEARVTDEKCKNNVWQLRDIVAQHLADNMVAEALFEHVRLPVVTEFNEAWRQHVTGGDSLGVMASSFSNISGPLVHPISLADVCLFELAEEALNVRFDETGEVLRLYGALFRESWMVYAFPGVVLVSERPVEVRRDADGHLHSAERPAVRFRDGLSLWAHHGGALPEHVADLGSDDWEPWMVLRETDPELRRHMVAQFGLDEVMRRAGARVILDQGDCAVVECAVGGLMGRATFIVDRVHQFVQATSVLEKTCNQPPERQIDEYRTLHKETTSGELHVHDHDEDFLHPDRHDQGILSVAYVEWFK